MEKTPMNIILFAAVNNVLPSVFAALSRAKLTFGVEIPMKT